MSLYVAYFSPTGGTKTVAECLAQSWEQAPIFIDMSNPHQEFSSYVLKSDDIFMVAVPSFGGRVPSVAIERLVSFKGNNALAIAVVTYGNRAYEDTLLELSDALTSVNFRVYAGVAAVTQHSILPKFGAGRPDPQDKIELSAFSLTLKNSSATVTDHTNLVLPGNHPYREFGGVPFKPNPSSHCTKCMLCAIQCPVSAISKDDPKKMDEKVCISCMRCVAICPAHARNVPKLLLSAVEMKLEKVCSLRKNNELFCLTTE